MGSELSRLASWWNDAFLAQKRLVLFAGGWPAAALEETANVLRWEWLDDDARTAVSQGMRAVMTLVHDWTDANR